jgi:hypothetical protein
MFAALERSNVTVHSLDPAGLVNISPTTRAGSNLRGGEVARAITDSTQEYLRNQNSLSVLPDLTGGRAIVNTNAPDALVPEILQESDSYYLLGFRVSGDGRTPGSHTIAVTVKRDDLRVHARNGYTITPAAGRPADSALPASIREALEPLLPATTFPLEVQAAAFSLPGASHAAVMLVVGLDAAATDAGPTAAATPFDLVSFALDPAGRSKAMARSTLDVAIAEETGPRRHVDVFSRFELSSGDYEIRVAGWDGARAGSVFTHVTVPSFQSEPLALSSILLGELRPAQAPPKETVPGLTFPIVPTSRRAFDGPRPVTAFVRIYQGTGRSDPIQPVTLQSFLLDSQGKTISSGSTAIPESQFDRDRASNHLVALPVSALPAGDYLLSLQATMGKRTTERAVRFAVTRPPATPQR